MLKEQFPQININGIGLGVIEFKVKVNPMQPNVLAILIQ